MNSIDQLHRLIDTLSCEYMENQPITTIFVKPRVFYELAKTISINTPYQAANLGTLYMLGIKIKPSVKRIKDARTREQVQR